GLGFILGPAIAGILSKYGVQIPFYFAAVLSMVSALGVFFLLPESLKKPVEEHREGRIAAIIESFRERDFGLVNLQYFLLVTAFSIMTYGFVLYTAFRFGYTPEQNGYLFAFVGLVSIIGQGVLFGLFAKRFGEIRLVVAGCFLMMLSLFAIPTIAPAYGGIAGLLGVTIFLAFGNALASPALTSLVSKISHEGSQGHALGIMQSGASLARAIGPTIGGILLNNAVNKIDDHTLYRTFWTASAIMFVAFLIAIYSAKIIVTDHNVIERIN
ncbi:MAG TPA: MFS transporter, partial [Pyrinomonadaceae bacterium]|nr:MFS transporter [Pyrinomonadaceae bacterium]